jgi:hypothetical protein
VRGNPLKYTDPTGYYSDDEIMTNYGCENWACIEALFQEGGAYAGLWGWLYILQQAQDGDTVLSTMIGHSGNHSMVGMFGRDASGKIFVTGKSYIDPTGGQPMRGVIAEGGFATFAAAGAYGTYELQGVNQSLGTGRDHKHDYVSIAPGTLLLTTAKAGTSIGPMMRTSGAAACTTGVACPVGAVVATVGEVYTVVGWSVTLADEYVLPLLTQADWQTVRFNAGVEVAAQVVDRAGSVGKKSCPSNWSCC